jgi:hypothetical protein
MHGKFNQYADTTRHGLFYRSVSGMSLSGGFSDFETVKSTGFYDCSPAH